MSADQGHPAVERREAVRRLPWLTLAFAAITLLGWLGGAFLMFLWPAASDWLAFIGGSGVIIAIPWLIICAFLPKPRSAPILLVTLMLIQASNMIDAQSDGGLIGLGFRIHASPIEQYLAKCRMFEFTEVGERRAIGWCEGRGYQTGGIPPGEGQADVMYDPAGNFLKPVSRRSPEWKQAFDEAHEYAGGAKWYRGARRLAGDFYLVDFD